MTDIVPRRSVFDFSKEYFIQNSRTTLGVKITPNYANMFLSAFERQLLDQCPNMPYIWLRYIDDTITKWNENEDKRMDIHKYTYVI